LKQLKIFEDKIHKLKNVNKKQKIKTKLKIKCKNKKMIKIKMNKLKKNLKVYF